MTVKELLQAMREDEVTADDVREFAERLQEEDRLHEEHERRVRLAETCR